MVEATIECFYHQKNSTPAYQSNVLSAKCVVVKLKFYVAYKNKEKKILVGDSESCARNKILVGACKIATPERCLYDRTYTQDNLLKRPLILLAFRSRLSDFYHIMTTLVSLLFFWQFCFFIKNDETFDCRQFSSTCELECFLEVFDAPHRGIGNCSLVFIEILHRKYLHTTRALHVALLFEKFTAELR